MISNLTVSQWAARYRLLKPDWLTGPDEWCTYAYDSVWAWASVLRRFVQQAGPLETLSYTNTSADLIVDQLIHSISFSGASGHVIVDPVTGERRGSQITLREYTVPTARASKIVVSASFTRTKHKRKKERTNDRAKSLRETFQRNERTERNSTNDMNTASRSVPLLWACKI